MKRLIYLLAIGCLAFVVSGCGKGAPMKTVAAYVDGGNTAPDATNRVLLVDVRPIDDYIQGHITGALCAPWTMIARNGQPLYTNGVDTVSPTAGTGVTKSWLAHLLINQLKDGSVATRRNSPMVFYGPEAEMAAELARKIGYSDVSWMGKPFEKWAAKYPDHVEKWAPGVTAVDRLGKSFDFTGTINSTNYGNVSTRGTRHAIAFRGGTLSRYAMLQADIPPFLFNEMLVYLGARPNGNMARGIACGTVDQWKEKFPVGQRVDFEVTWDRAGVWYPLADLFQEAHGEFDNTRSFVPVGIEPRMGGTRDANLNSNPGCIFCFYASVCGITSNARANEETWLKNRGLNDLINYPNDDRNYYAGRFFPKMDLLPASGEPITIRAIVVTGEK